MGQSSLKSVEDESQDESSRQRLLQRYKVCWWSCTGQMKLHAPCCSVWDIALLWQTDGLAELKMHCQLLKCKSSL